MSADSASHVAMRNDERLNEDTERGLHVIAAFSDAERAKQAAQRLSDAGRDGSVSVRIRRPGQELSEGDSFEELSETDLTWIRFGLLGAIGGAVVGAIIGGVLGAIAAAVGWWSGGDAVIAALGGAGALAWAGFVLFGFRAQWKMSYRDVATGAAAIVTFDTTREEAAEAAFALLRDQGADRVDRYDGELKFMYVSPNAPADSGVAVTGDGQLRQ
jgi:hypothetical protein